MSGVGPTAVDGSNEAGVGVLEAGVLEAGVLAAGVLAVVLGAVSWEAAVCVAGTEAAEDAEPAAVEATPGPVVVDAVELLLHEVITSTPITTLEMAVR